MDDANLYDDPKDSVGHPTDSSLRGSGNLKPVKEIKEDPDTNKNLFKIH